LENNLVRIDAPTLDRYLELYANDESVELSPLQYRAIDRLYELGFEHGFYDAPIKAEEYTIPREYLDYRHS
ncbi:MAG: succinate--CoA ligase, partial [Campylobacterales bacterium]